MVESQQPIPDHIVAPKNIRLKVSKVDDSRIGAFCVTKIAKGTEFGPFVGRKVYIKDDVSVDQRYSWEVFDLETFKYLYTVDATSAADGNWMRYVCCARYFEEQNIVSTQNGDQVYYKALQDIAAGEELLTWFQPKKKQRKKRSSWKNSTETEEGCTSNLESVVPSVKQSKEMTKRRRKPKIIPDSYDGPFDFEEQETVERKEPKPPKPSNRDDLFEPLQPGQKRRRRKKFSEATDSTSTSKAGSPEREVKTPSEDSTGEKPLVMDFADDNIDEECNGAKRKESDPKKSNYSKTICDINDTVEWDFPEKGEEYSFELLKHHISYQGGKKVYKCDICLGLYKHMFSLKRHYLRNHINYKYLSKADLTNCLINLAQVKQNMSHLESKDDDKEGNGNTTKTRPGDQPENDSLRLKTLADDPVPNGDAENENQIANKLDNLADLKDLSRNETENDREDACLLADKLQRKDSAVSMETEGCEEDGSNSLNSSSNSVNSVPSSSHSEHSKMSADTPDADAGGGSNFSIPNGIDKLTYAKSHQEPEFPGLFKCYTCSEVFDRKENIRDHLKNHPAKEGLMFSCDQCNMFFSFKHNLVRHQRSHNSEKSRSPTPDVSSKNHADGGKEASANNQLMHGCHGELGNNADKPDNAQLKSKPHTGNHHPHKVYKCGVCPFKYENQDALVKHVENKHKNGSKFQCKYCGKDFLSMPNMKKHVRFHLGYRATCKECKDTFGNVGALRKHTRVAHPEVYRARLVERLEKFGVLRGPDKNALKQKIVDKIVERKAKAVFNNTLGSVQNSSETEKENKSDKVESKGTDQELHHADTEIGFAADEIDDGGSRFKFSCTVCKKRFSSYINMCRHRRKAHNNDVKSRAEQQPVPNDQPSRTQSPIVENPDEIAAFYANVSHNIATNINCYIDGRPESLENFVEHIKVEGYSGNFGYSGSESEISGVPWNKYNFPPDFRPGKTVSYSEINSVLDIPSDVDTESRLVGSRKANKSDSGTSDDSDSDCGKLEIIENNPSVKEGSEESQEASEVGDKKQNNKRCDKVNKQGNEDDRTEEANLDQVPISYSVTDNTDLRSSGFPAASSQISSSSLPLSTQQIQVFNQQSLQNIPFILSQPILSSGSILPSPVAVSQVRFPVNQVPGVPGQFILPFNQAGPVLSHPLVVNQPLVLNQPSIPSQVTIPVNQAGVPNQIALPMNQGAVSGPVTIPFSQIAGSSQISLATQIVLPVSSQIAFPVLPGNLPQPITALSSSVSDNPVVLNQPPLQISQLAPSSVLSNVSAVHPSLTSSQTSAFTSAVNLVQIQNQNQNVLNSNSTADSADNMGIASYGMKMLSSLVAGKKAPPSECQQTANDVKTKQKLGEDKGQYLKVRIADGIILNPESPAARTFHQVQKGEYASFQDDLCPEMDSILNGGHVTRSRPVRLDGQVFDKEYYNMQSIKHSINAQAQLDSLYAEIDLSLDESSKPIPKTPRRLSRMCEDLLGISPNSKQTHLNCSSEKCQRCTIVESKPYEYSSDEKDMDGETADAIDLEPDDASMRWIKEEKPNYSDAPEESPFYNYETIAFGKHGNIESVCATCKKPFKDFDSLVRHHLRKHPASVCGMLEVEKGNGIEDLHFVEPSCVGTLAVTDPGLDAASHVGSLKCTYCGAAFKTVNKLHVHIVNCSPIDPVYGSQMPVNCSSSAAVKKNQISEGPKDLDSFEVRSFSTIKPGSSRKRIFTGCRKWTSVILPDSPVKESAVAPVTAPEKPPQLVISGYNPLRHVRRRELTEVVDLLTCEGCGLKCKTIILLERHVRHCTRKEKFRTMKPLTCPIIDESQDKMKNMCFYCEKNFTYTKSLINHFQDFCPVKKAKLDRDEISEEDKEREAAILDRIQKGEEEKMALKEKELENGTKRRITWQVGRKPKRKGNAWTIIKRRQSQQDEDGNVGDDEDGEEIDETNTAASDMMYSEDTTETNEEKTGEPSNETSVQFDRTLEESADRVSSREINIENKRIEPSDHKENLSLKIDKPAVKGRGRPRTKPIVKADDHSKEIVEKNDDKLEKMKDEIKEEPNSGSVDMNTSLNCTARYQVNQQVKLSKERKARDVSKGSMLFQCVSTQNLAADEAEEAQDTQKKRTRSTQPDSTRIVEGKRKRERVGKVEEFLRNAFSRKRKRKDQEETRDSEKPAGESCVTSQASTSPALASISSAPVIALATPGASGELAVTSLVFLPNSCASDQSPAGNQKTFQPIRPAISSPGAHTPLESDGKSLNVPSIDEASNKDSNDTCVSPIKGKRGRPRKHPIVIKPTAAALNPETGKRRPGRPRKIKPEEQMGDLATVNTELNSEINASTCSSVARNDSADDEQVVPDLDIKKEVEDECSASSKPPERDSSKDAEVVENLASSGVEESTDDVDGDCAVQADARQCETPHFEIRTHIENNVICTTEVNLISESIKQETVVAENVNGSIPDENMVVPTRPDNFDSTDDNRDTENSSVDDSNDVIESANDVVDGEEGFEHVDVPNASETVKAILLEKLNNVDFTNRQNKFNDDPENTNDEEDDKSDATPPTERYDSSREVSPVRDVTVDCGTYSSTDDITHMENNSESVSQLEPEHVLSTFSENRKTNSDTQKVDIVECVRYAEASVDKTNKEIDQAESGIIQSDADNVHGKVIEVQMVDREHTHESRNDIQEALEARKRSVTRSEKEKSSVQGHLGNSSGNLSGETEVKPLNKSNDVMEHNLDDIKAIESGSESQTTDSEMSDFKEDYGELQMVLSPGERVKMNKRSCKKDVDLASPVWVKRTKHMSGGKNDKQDQDLSAGGNKVKPSKPGEGTKNNMSRDVTTEVPSDSVKRSKKSENSKSDKTAPMVKSMKADAKRTDSQCTSGKGGKPDTSSSWKGRKRKEMDSKDNVSSAKSKIQRVEKDASSLKTRSKR